MNRSNRGTRAGKLSSYYKRNYSNSSKKIQIKKIQTESLRGTERKTRKLSSNSVDNSKDCFVGPTRTGIVAIFLCLGETILSLKIQHGFKRHEGNVIEWKTAVKLRKGTPKPLPIFRSPGRRGNSDGVIERNRAQDKETPFKFRR